MKRVIVAMNVPEDMSPQDVALDIDRLYDGADSTVWLSARDFMLDMKFNPGDRVCLVSEQMCDTYDEDGRAVGYTIDPAGTVAHVIEQEESGEVLLDLCCVGQWYVQPSDIAITDEPLTSHDKPDFHEFPDPPGVGVTP